MPFKKKNRCWP